VRAERIGNVGPVPHGRRLRHPKNGQPAGSRFRGWSVVGLGPWGGPLDLGKIGGEFPGASGPGWQGFAPVALVQVSAVPAGVRSIQNPADLLGIPQGHQIMEISRAAALFQLPYDVPGLRFGFPGAPAIERLAFAAKDKALIALPGV